MGLVVYGTEPVHEFFGLSYSNYIVLPRSVLQSMPLEWQRRFIRLVEEIPEVIEEQFEPEGGYRVLALDVNKKFVSDPYSNYERGRRRLKRRKV
jgi:hypothetical protein